MSLQPLALALCLVVSTLPSQALAQGNPTQVISNPDTGAIESKPAEVDSGKARALEHFSRAEHAGTKPKAQLQPQQQPGPDGATMVKTPGYMQHQVKVSQQDLTPRGKGGADE